MHRVIHNTGGGGGGATDFTFARRRHEIRGLSKNFFRLSHYCEYRDDRITCLTSVKSTDFLLQTDIKNFN